MNTEMKNGFKANNFSATSEDWGWLTVLWASSTEDEDFYLMFQRAYEFTEGEILFGQDKPYIEYCGQGWSWYGHILSVKLQRESISIQMDKEAASEMDNDGQLEITFNLDDRESQKLERALENTFEGFDYYQRT